MKVRIADLPKGVSEDDIRELLDNSDDIRTIELISDENPDRPVAVVELKSDAAGEAVIQTVNGRNWKNATLRADKLLY